MFKEGKKTNEEFEKGRKEILVPGAIVRHFKRDFIEDKITLEYLYQIIGTGNHSETKEELVIYKSLETGKICCRPINMFLSKTDTDKYPAAKQKYRFELISPRQEI